MKITRRPKLDKPFLFVLLIPFYLLSTVAAMFCANRVDETAFWWGPWIILVFVAGFCVIGMLESFTLVPRRDSSAPRISEES